MSIRGTRPITKERWQKIKEVFEAVLLAPREQWGSVVAQLCQGDIPLCAEVESLLAKMDDAESFLQRPAIAGLAAEFVARRQLFQVGDRISTRFEIMRFIGQGGMGEVYEAHDLEMDCRVALKTIRPEIALQRDMLARFKHEVQLTRLVTHPNVCRTFDVFRHRIETSTAAHDVIYLTMELLEGETLARRLLRGRMTTEEALPLVLQMAKALEAAHAAGVIHRDFKPGNVILCQRPAPASSEGLRAVVTDFGLARNFSLSESLSVPLTERGTIIGTLAYMSPEQLEGKELTPASDIYSLGLVLYEMITGIRPFHAESPWTEAIKRLREDPEPPIRIAQEIGEIWNAVVLRCLERFSDKRFSAAREVSDSLQGLQRSPHGAESRGPSSIAVLPFTNLSGNPADEYFSDGMSEEIINALSHLEGLRVSARTSSFSFKGKAVEVTEIARKLGVMTVLEGSVRKAGNRIRITAQLVNMADGFHLWSERYDRDMQDVFALQDEIARSIAERLEVTLKGGRQMLVKAGTDNLEAYECYLKGRALAYQRGWSLPRAQEYFQRAVALDEKYALAWAELAYVFMMLAWYGFLRPQVTFPQAREAATHAVALDPSLPEAHGALACVHMFNWDWFNADREFRRALELNPRYVLALSWYGCWVLQAYAGRFEEGLAHVQQAVELDPLSGHALAHLAWAYSLCDRNAESVVVAQNAVKLDPESIFTQLNLAYSLYFQGQVQESVTVAESALGMSGRHPLFIAFLALVYAHGGRLEQACAAHAELSARSRWEYVSPMLLAISAAALGELDEAIRYAGAAHATRDPLLTIPGRYGPGAKRLCEDHRFREILDSMGF